jgi:tetratricopeptide (TPR) repeat protein
MMHAVKDDNDVPETFNGARSLEIKGDLKTAALLYEKLLKRADSNVKIITRLMIVYRKLKNFRKELSTIERAIKIYSKDNTDKKANKQVNLISKKLNLLLGHTDKKGKSLLIPPEVLKLQKRKDALLKKHPSLK